MRISSKREILRWQNDVRAGEGRRFILRIQVKGGSTSPFAPPLDSTSEHLDPSTDTIVYGVGIFSLTSDKSEAEAVGAVILRKATLDVHPKFETFFRQAYAVQVGGEKGSFQVVGVDTGVNKISTRVKLHARQ